jgi:hypothetical protein
MKSETTEVKRLIKNLNSNDHNLVLETIQNLRYNGKVYYIPVVIELLRNTNIDEIKNSIACFLNDLKYQRAVNELVNAIQNKRYEKERETIISACWQSGLDFSRHIKTFVKLCFTENYQVAIEAFSVIENSISRCTKKEITEYISLVKSHIDEADREKKLLLVEMINMMKEVIKNEDQNETI